VLYFFFSTINVSRQASIYQRGGSIPMTCDAILDTDIFYMLFSRHNLAEPKKIRKLSSGLQYTTYYIKTQRLRYIAKIYDRQFSYSSAPFLKEVLAFVAEGSLDFAKIALQDYIDDRFVLLFDYQEGKILSSWNDKQSYSLGVALSRLHVKSTHFTPTTLNEGFLEKALHIYRKVALQIPEHFSEIHTEIAYFESRRYMLPKGLLHGDPYDKNIMFSSAGSVTLLDNTLMCNDLFLFDISHVFKKYYFDKIQKNPLKGFKSFIQGYETIRMITDDEKIMMPEILRMRIVYSILFLFESSISISGTVDLFIDSCYMNYLKLLQAKHIKKIDL
jgi:homoserine kinase type II